MRLRERWLVVVSSIRLVVLMLMLILLRMLLWMRIRDV